MMNETPNLDLPNILSASPNYIQVSPPNKNKFSFLAFLLAILFLAFLAGIGFGVGFVSAKVIANIKANPQQLEGIVTGDKAPEEGWLIYKDKNNSFSIAYPNDWKVQTHDPKEVEGVKLSKDGETSVELWVKFDQPVTLSDEQKAGLKAEAETKNSTINGNPVLITTYEYKAGPFFIVAIIPATEEKPQITMWVKAADIETKDLAMKVVNSFKFD